MSKSRGNVVNPWEVMSTHGADATRWYMYTASPPGNSRRFSVNLVGETVRKFLNTLWNTYSFFVTYANLSEWRAGDEGSAVRKPARPLGAVRTQPARARRHAGDGELRRARAPRAQWATLWTTSATGMCASAAAASGTAIRRRWQTLYEVLVTVAKLLAPATPFVAEELYQNLVVNAQTRRARQRAPGRWPQVNAAQVDEQLSADMAMVQRVTSLGHAARQNANLKVRQPLAQVVVRTRTSEEEAALRRLQQFVLDELNVKTLGFTHASGDLVDVAVFPYPKQLGQKYGKGYPKIRTAMAALDQLELAGQAAGRRDGRARGRGRALRGRRRRMSKCG